MNNRQYWEERMENTQRIANKNVNNKIKKMYLDLFKRLDKDLVKLWLDMANSGEVNYTNLTKSEHYKSIMDLIQVELNKIGNKNVDYLQASLFDTFYQATDDISKWGNFKISTVLNENLAKEVVLANYKTAKFSERVWDSVSELRAKLNDVISLSAIGGYDVRKVASEIQRALNAGYSESKRITITETSRVFNESCRKQALDSGLFKTYTILNEKQACDKCIEAYDNGRHYPLEKSILPMHPYCKCTMLIDLD